MTWTFNGSRKDLRKDPSLVADLWPEYETRFSELQAAGQYPYNDEFRCLPSLAGVDPGIQETAIYCLQQMRHQREAQARVDAAIGDGFRKLDTLATVTKYAHVILYKPGRSEWHTYQDARLVPETKPRQAEVTGQIHALIPKGKRTHGVYVGGSGYAVLVKEAAK